MSAQFEGGTIRIDLHEVLESMDAGSKSLLVQSLSCDDDILKYAADQIVHGSTPDGYSGSEGGQASVAPWTPLDSARRRVAMASGDIASREVGRLERALAAKEEALRRESAENRAMRFFLQDRGFDVSKILESFA